MSVTVVVGAQWGDEGKGRIVDYLAQRAQMVIRFQGGDNAGHTVVNDYGTFALHIIPSGIFNPDTACIVGAGTVVNPDGLANELEALHAARVDTGSLWLSERAHVVMPYHQALDGLQEAARQGKARIGTTKRGIGPAYADKAARTGVRLGDLGRPDHLHQRLAQALDRINPQLQALGGTPVELDAMMALAARWHDQIKDRVIDTVPRVRAAVRADQNVLLEGQLGAMRDLDWGTYPYVTSSNPIAGGAAAGAGLPPTAIDHVIGVVKAYATSVGAGPFPGEDFGPRGQRLREIGQEFGATTGRPRRCGWLDAVALRRAAWLNGFTQLAVTKLDVLDSFEAVPVCTGYTLDDAPLERVPDTVDYDRVEPVWTTYAGWQAPTTAARTFDALPANAQSFVNQISTLAEVPIGYVSVGPAREQLIVMETP
jgi:adenylosuccinate synthase